MFKSGFVTIVGKPNSGKSTLLNYIIGHKISIATPKQNTTRNQIKGIYNDKDSQIVFIDTPGFIKAKTNLDQDMRRRIIDSLNGVDIILYLLPFWKDLDDDYLKNINLVSGSKTKKYLLLTKIDKAQNDKDIFHHATKHIDNNLFDEIIPISSFRNLNIERLIITIKNEINGEVPYYDTNKSFEYDDKFYASEIIREKALYNLNNEIPHQLFISITDFSHKEDSLYIRSEIIVSRENLKRIVIGKEGSKLKVIGQASRKELQKYFGKNIYLELFVKVRKDWQNKDSIIKRI